MKIRNMAGAKIIPVDNKDATWTDWTIEKGVRDGYSASGWVYKAVSMIAKSCASIPWLVVDDEGVEIQNHPLNHLIKNPSPFFTMYDLIELLVSWQQLTGQAYLKKIQNNGTIELLPISPDRIAPIANDNNDTIIKGYEIKNLKGDTLNDSDFNVDNVIHFKSLNPANPIEGLSPLQVAGKAVDVDVNQQKWNNTAMANRGVVDAVFTFDRDLPQNVFESITSKLKKMFTGRNNARGIGVIGSNAKFQRVSMTPAEMDFIESRRFNREEIAGIFGIPLPLMGVSDSMTYSNFTSSQRIFWESTLIPILEDLCSTLNNSFKDELGAYKIAFDLSDVSALRDSELEKLKSVDYLFRMGVPMEQLNTKYSLGIEKYDGWEVSRVLKKPPNSED